MFIILNMSGTNFGLNDSLEYTEFEFDSEDAVEAYNQTYAYTDWPLYQLGKPLANVAALKILEAQIPFTYYIFNSSNNTFLLSESDGGGNVTVTIPVGNYTSTTILAALNTALNAVSANSHTYTTTYSDLTQKLTVTSNAGTTKTFTFTFGTGVDDPGYTNPMLWLGFAGGANTSTTAQVLAAPYVIQLTGANYVYINSRSLGALVHLYLPGNGILNVAQGGADGPQIAKVPITSQPGGVTYWQDPVPLMWFDVGNTQFGGNLDFYLTLGNAQFQVPLKLNGASFSLKLGLLTNTSSHNSYLGGGKQNDRVVQRTWPTGSAMQF